MAVLKNIVEKITKEKKKCTFGKVLKVFFKVIFAIVLSALCIVAIQHLFNGGIETIIVEVQAKGFWIYLKDFFVSIWTGFKTLVGF